MKKYVLLLILPLLISCNNDDNSSDNRLEGKWNWIKSSGGFGGTSIPKTSEQKVILEFSGNTLKTYQNGNLIRENKFFIVTKKSIYGGNQKMIVIDKGLSITQEYYVDRSFDFKNKKLFLYDECADCWTSEYERIK